MVTCRHIACICSKIESCFHVLYISIPDMVSFCVILCNISLPSPLHLLLFRFTSVCNISFAVAIIPHTWSGIIWFSSELWHYRYQYSMSRSVTRRQDTNTLMPIMVWTYYVMFNACMYDNSYAHAYIYSNKHSPSHACIHIYMTTCMYTYIFIYA